MLILDEPTASLDVSVKASIINLLIELREMERLTYLFITHEIDIAKHVSDRIAVMYLGRIVEQGPTEEIFENPRHPYTQSLLGSVPVPDPQLRAELKPISGEVPSRDRPAFRMHLPHTLSLRLRPVPRGHPRVVLHRLAAPCRLPPGGGRQVDPWLDPWLGSAVRGR